MNVKECLSNRSRLDHLLGHFRCDNRIVGRLDTGQVDADAFAPVALGGSLDLRRDDELPDLAAPETLLATNHGLPLALAVLAHHADLLAVGHLTFEPTRPTARRTIRKGSPLALAGRASFENRLLDELVTLARADAVGTGPLDDGDDLEVSLLRDLAANIVPHEAVARLNDFRKERPVLPNERRFECLHDVLVVDGAFFDTKKQQIFFEQRCFHFCSLLNLVG